MSKAKVFYIRNFIDFYEHFHCKTAIAIGNFDGMHKGHLSLFENLTAFADKNNLEPICISFYPHTKQKNGTEGIKNITSLAEKLEILSSIGIGKLYILKFTKEFENLSKEEFLKAVFAKFNVNSIFAESGFRFGKNAYGDIDFLEDFCKLSDVNFFRCESIKIGDIKCSASHIRELILDGKLDTVNQFLSRFYSLSGLVVHGEKNGGKLGFPTANLEIKKTKTIPTNGVYLVKVFVKNKEYIGACNIGFRPSLHVNSKLTIEVHILDFSQEIYGEKITVYFVRRIRDERKFTSLDELKRQIAKDIEFCRTNTFS